MSLEATILDLLDSIGKFDFTILIQFLAWSLLLIWIFVVVWVWNDAKSRTESFFFRFICALLVLPLNLPGLIIYFIIRPQETLEQSYWTDLEKRYLLYETADLGSCEQCGFDLGPGFNICPNCKFQIKTKCTGCEVMIDKGWLFCPFCGAESGREGSNRVDPVQPLSARQTKRKFHKSVNPESSREIQKSEFYTKLGQSIINVVQKLRKRRITATKSKKENKDDSSKDPMLNE
ncbi:zinc ribbon domain-containing protein [Candidatus Nomurabacteria bacterium]|nr:zinc ribbon domain-containing protein [Candidatus Nomurabacteria bacterium]